MENERKQIRGGEKKIGQPTSGHAAKAKVSAPCRGCQRHKPRVTYFTGDPSNQLAIGCFFEMSHVHPCADCASCESALIKPLLPAAFTFAKYKDEMTWAKAVARMFVTLKSNLNKVEHPAVSTDKSERSPPRVLNEPNSWPKQLADPHVLQKPRRKLFRHTRAVVLRGGCVKPLELLLSNTQVKLGHLDL